MAHWGGTLSIPISHKMVGIKGDKFPSCLIHFKSPQNDHLPLLSIHLEYTELWVIQSNSILKTKRDPWYLITKDMKLPCIPSERPTLTVREETLSKNHVLQPYAFILLVKLKKPKWAHILSSNRKQSTQDKNFQVANQTRHFQQNFQNVLKPDHIQSNWYPGLKTYHWSDQTQFVQCTMSEIGIEGCLCLVLNLPGIPKITKKFRAVWIL